VGVSKLRPQDRQCLWEFLIPLYCKSQVITRKKAFTRTSTSDNVLRYTAGGSVNQPLANLITSHTFSQPDANMISITLTAQTRNGDPNTQHKRQYTLAETVLRRN
jgi:hypothetical protein